MARQPASRYITNSSRSTRSDDGADMRMCLEVAVFGETGTSVLDELVS